jgi:hypothetical protein
MTYEQLKQSLKEKELPKRVELEDEIIFNIPYHIEKAVEYIDGIKAKGLDPKDNDHCKYWKKVLIKIYNESKEV